jgi:acyl transferase domain-containing protein
VPALATGLHGGKWAAAYAGGAETLERAITGLLDEPSARATAGGIAATNQWTNDLDALVLELIARGGSTVCVEIGPRPTLAAAAAALGIDLRVFPVWLPDGDAWVALFDLIAALYVTGHEPDLTAFGDLFSRREIVDVPTYPFARERCWLDPTGVDRARVVPSNPC